MTIFGFSGWRLIRRNYPELNCMEILTGNINRITWSIFRISYLKHLRVKNIKLISVISLLLILALYSCRDESRIDHSNPFFAEFETPFNVPPFEKIEARHFLPAFEKGINDARKDIIAIISNREKPSFENTVEAFDRSGELLNRVTIIFFSQATANTNDSIRSLELEISPKLAGFRDEINLDLRLFKRIKAVYDNRENLGLSDEQTFMLENLYKGFVRNGAELTSADQDTLRSLNQRLSLAMVRYNQNIMSETNGYKMFITKYEDLTGLPGSFVTAAAEEAANSGFIGKWAFTTVRPSIIPFLTYADSREKRKELFSAYIMRGNTGNEYDNNKLLAEIVSLRARRAKILGYRDHSSLVLDPRMARRPENVLDLLNGLWEKSIIVAVKERDELQALARKEGGLFKIEPYDWWYYAEKLRKKKYDLDDLELRPYFKLDNVREGAFAVANRLFGITFERIENIPLPAPDAMAFEVRESDGKHLGILYMDFYPRPSKQQGAWCGPYRAHHITDGKEITPVVSAVFNFTPPSGELPSLLSLDESSTLFHEFGHALDFLFNKSTFNNINIAWDFVELPSQLIEHWATEPEVLTMYARHFTTGKPIPQVLIEKIRKSGYFNQGFETVEYLAAAFLDIAYHTLEEPVSIDVQKFESEYFKKLGLIPEIVSRYRSTYFRHITDGYDSGYYSYIWAAVLDNDVFEAFKENGIFDNATAKSLRRYILERNGTMDAMKMFVNFRGREPVIEPLLKNRGLISD